MNSRGRLSGCAGGMRSRCWMSALAVAVTVLTATAGSGTAEPAEGGRCPALYALGVQGAGESSPDTSPTTDTGMLSEVFRPLLANAMGTVDRVYVPYQASFGGVSTGGEATPYSRSIQDGVGRLREMAHHKLRECPNTRIAVAGYSQGAHVASLFAQEAGRGGGTVPAAKIAAVALFGDPTRQIGATLFPGAPGKTTPDPAPGTAGAAVGKIMALPREPLTGGGIGPQRDTAQSFGALTGRVASFCVAGDLSCDAPEHAPILRVVGNIASQSQLSGGDPLRSLAGVTQALAFTAIKTATAVINSDVQGTSLASLSLSPRKSISERLAEASDPRTPLDLHAALKAVMKVGTIALNSAVTFAKAVLTPTNIAEIATAGLADPIAGLLAFGKALLFALPQLIPPTTGIALVGQAFSAVVQNVTDNSDLLNIATWTKYSDTVAKHGAYVRDPVAAGGQAPVRFIADWFAALAADVTKTQATTTTSSTPRPGASAPVNLPWGRPPATTTTAPTSGDPSRAFPWAPATTGGTRTPLPAVPPTSPGARQ